MLNVSQTASYEITLVRVSVRLSLSLCLSLSVSIRPSVTKFSQDWIIIFSDILHDDG